MQINADDTGSPERREGASPEGGMRCCVFLQKPFKDCYCLNMTSSNIRKMLSFCTGDFSSCEIYRWQTELETGGKK